MRQPPPRDFLTFFDFYGVGRSPAGGLFVVSNFNLQVGLFNVYIIKSWQLEAETSKKRLDKLAKL